MTIIGFLLLTSTGILYSVLLWSFANSFGPSKEEKEFYDHLDRFWNGDFKEEMDEIERQSIMRFNEQKSKIKEL